MNPTKTLLLLFLALTGNTVLFAASAAKVIHSELTLNVEKNHLLDKPVLFENETIRIELFFEDYKSASRSTVKVFGILKVINKTTEKVELSFNKEIYYNGKCNSCGSDENLVKMELEPESAKEGNPVKNENGLRVFHSFKTGESDKKLTDLHIIDVIIKTV